MPDSWNFDAAIIGLTLDLDYCAGLYEIGAVQGPHALVATERNRPSALAGLSYTEAPMLLSAQGTRSE